MFWKHISQITRQSGLHFTLCKEKLLHTGLGNIKMGRIISQVKKKRKLMIIILCLLLGLISKLIERLICLFGSSAGFPDFILPDDMS